jgi:3-hydroxy acid dehydrogenase/malonic semialdehyde reductase
MNILITGVTAGFGLSILEVLSSQDYTVIGCGRRKDRLNEIQSKHKNVTNFELDITDSCAVIQFAAELKKRALEPDVIINNAGLGLGLSPADQCKISDWERMVDVNIKGLLYVTHAFLPRMREQNSGYVINIGSVAATNPYPGGNVYGATKAFVSQFSNNLRSDLLGTDIRVTCIEPGLAETEFSSVRFAGDEERSKKVYQGANPLKPTDIAETVRWLLTLPPHMNVNSIEIMPTSQAWGSLTLNRK